MLELRREDGCVSGAGSRGEAGIVSAVVWGGVFASRANLDNRNGEEGGGVY